MTWAHLNTLALYSQDITGFSSIDSVIDKRIDAIAPYLSYTCIQVMAMLKIILDARAKDEGMVNTEAGERARTPRGR